MNRRLLVAIALSFITVFALQYFTQRKEPVASGGGSGEGQIRSGQFYNAPVQQCWHKEPNREIDFIDKKVETAQESIVTVETSLCTHKFSNFGGVLQSLAFKNHPGKKVSALETINTNLFEQREEGCFLLAFEEKTPFLYKFVSQEKKDNTFEIVYETMHEGWRIRKTYVVHDESYKVDLHVDFEAEGKENKSLAPRLFFPSPVVSEIPDNAINGFVTPDGKSVEKVASSQELNGVWGMPEVFGAEDKYFAHGLVNDGQHFVQGGYYKRINKTLFSILEGSEIKEKKSIKLSFYIGPKLLHDLGVVDTRLEDLLSFGWLSWLCKILLRFLEFLYKYFGNFGIAIIVLTILLKLPFVPLSISSRRKMEEYQKYQPTITRIRTKYRQDLKKQQEEILLFHKEHNISPTTPMVGCLPLLIQLPILFALYRVLGNYVSLYQAPFFGWLHDLSAQDPYYVLPILMGVSMILQQKMAPVSDEKQRLMMMFMPIVMTAIFINFPAGLVLYWFVNNLLTVGEDIVRKKMFS